MTYKVLDVCAGIGGFSLGLEATGYFETVGFIEIDPFCQSILHKHWPNTPVLGDVKHVTRDSLRSSGVSTPIDVLTAGFPCQPVSAAGGKYATGINSDKWLWPHIARLVREVEPRYILLENAPALLTANGGAAFSEVLSDLASSGYDAEWHCLSASAFGAWHKRERLWIVAYASSLGLGISQAIITPPPHSQRYIPPSERAGEAELHALVAGSQVARRSGRWEPEPGLCGVVDGVSNRLYQERVAALGNSIVPMIARHLGECIIAFEQGD